MTLNTQKVRAGEELDLLRLAPYLAINGLAKSENDILEVLQFSNGYSNLTYKIKTSSHNVVLRTPPKGATKRGHDMGREFKVLSNLERVFDKVPKTHCFDSDGRILGKPFYIMEYIGGPIVTFKTAKEWAIDGAAFDSISRKWLETFVELHKVDYKNAGLEDLGRPEGYVSRQVSNWGKQYIKAATMDIPEAQKVMSWMERNQPTRYESCLIHNDFKYDNVVFRDKSWNEIAAILDWEMCTLGDPLMDLGTSLGYWIVDSDPDLFKHGLPSPTIFKGNPSRSEILHQYSLKSGKEIHDEVFYYVYGLFKIAVIAQQIYYRYDKGLTTNKKFAELDKSCQFLIMVAWHSIQTNKIENLF